MIPDECKIQDNAIILKNLKCVSRSNSVLLLYSSGRIAHRSRVIKVTSIGLYITSSLAHKINPSLLAGDIVVTGQFNNIHFKFKLASLRPLNNIDGDCLFAELPPLLIWLQRRDYFRIKIPEFVQEQCVLELIDTDASDLSIIDLSLTGIAFKVPNKKIDNLDLIKRKEIVSKSAIYMFGSTLSQYSIGIKVINILNVNNKLVSVSDPKDKKWTRVGCQFMGLNLAQESAIQKNIRYIERNYYSPQRQIKKRQ